MDSSRRTTGHVLIAILATACLVHPAMSQLSPFTEEAVARGLVYQIQDYPQTEGIYGFGAGFSDLDSDGDPDVIVVGREDGTVGIFENDGTGHFIDRSVGSGIPTLSEASAFACGDMDADGDPDLYLTQIGMPDKLLMNNGDFTFIDVTRSSGIIADGAGKDAAWVDYDLDGDLDLYVCNYPGAIAGTEGIGNQFWNNNGDGTFTDIAPALGLDSLGLTFVAAWTDYDRDGDLDLYLSNDRGFLFGNPPNELFRNDGGVFVDVSESSGAGLALFSMGLAVGDFDRNGWPDFYMTNIASSNQPNKGINPLLLNQGDGTFIESAADWGVETHITGWGSVFYDLTNNGHLDLYVNNMFEPNSLYLNSGSQPTFEAAAMMNVLASDQPSYCASVGDIDLDGDLDMINSDLEGNIQMYINHEGQNRNWIKLRMAGFQGNPEAIGSRIEIDTTTGVQQREIFAGGNGYLGQNELVRHFGLDDQIRVESVTATWPGGSSTRVLQNLPANMTWTIYPEEQLGDGNHDGQVDQEDLDIFNDCYASGFAPGCEMMDFDGNCIIDEIDHAKIESMVDGPATGDLDGDGLVNSVDLGILLAAWGANPGSVADIDLDGFVLGTDLGLLLANWTR